MKLTIAILIFAVVAIPLGAVCMTAFSNAGVSLLLNVCASDSFAACIGLFVSWVILGHLGSSIARCSINESHPTLASGQSSIST